MLAILLLLAATVQDLAHVVDSVRAATGTNAVSVAVRLPDGAIRTHAAGTTPSTAFEIGSITKTFTGALAAQLAAEGRLDLDAAVARWLPHLPNADRITLRHLLTHTSGLPDVFTMPAFFMHLMQDGARVWAASDVLALVGDTLFSPGAGWRYASTGFVAAGAILETVLGQPLRDAWRARFFAPLGMTRTFYGGREPVEPPVAAPPSVAYLTAAGPAGAVITTAADLATWTWALGSGTLLVPTAHAALTTFVDRPDGHRYGLGLLRVELDGLVLLGHRGNTVTFSAATWYVPAFDLAITVLTDKPGEPVTPFVRAILSLCSAGLPRCR